MKKGILYLMSLAVLISFARCKEDVPTLFAEPDGIYFSSSSDSMFYSFAKYPNRMSDTLRLPVTVLGNAAGTDRIIDIEGVSDSDVNGKEGVHFKLLTPYKLPAGKISTTLPVVIYRTADLDSAFVNLKLHLKANQNFQAGISAKTSVKVKLAYLQKPPTWGEIGGSQWAGYSGNFGTWTKTKYKVILSALYDPIADTTVSEFPYNRFAAPAIYLQYLQLVRNYIRINYPGNYSAPIGIGATLRDPDANNNVVQVGPANY